MIRERRKLNTGTTFRGANFKIAPLKTTGGITFSRKRNTKTVETATKPAEMIRNALPADKTGAKVKTNAEGVMITQAKASTSGRPVS
jgi:hypothetical protein